MINIAKFRRAFFYFWVFGGISVLLDLDHIIQIYLDGLELSLENIAYHGTRTLHIPILILTGCICIITGALLLRFLHISFQDNTNPLTSTSLSTKSSPGTRSSAKRSIMINLATYSMVAPFRKPSTQKLIIIECPRCNHRMAIKPTNRHLEFPCTNCGVEGFVDIS